MAITKRQKQLDDMKWLESERRGADACGSFDFCAECDKSLKNPCDKAYKKVHADEKPARKPRSATSATTDKREKAAR